METAEFNLRKTSTFPLKELLQDVIQEKEKLSQKEWLRGKTEYSKQVEGRNTGKAKQTWYKNCV